MTGSQIPRLRIEPERAVTDGAAAAALMEASQAVQGRAGDDFEVVPVSMPTRNIVRVQSANARGEQRNRDENTLLKSTFGGDE